MDGRKQIAIWKLKGGSYCRTSPLNPSRRHADDLLPDHLTYESSEVYEALGNLLLVLGFEGKDPKGESWNPLSEVICPGDKVLVKPNLVRNYHGNGRNVYSVITHSSVIRGVVGYALKACGSKGEITIADSPILEAFGLT